MIKYEHPRYIPSSETNDMLTQLRLSQIETKRGYLDSNSFNTLPSDQSPFNPILFSDVRYNHDPIISRRNTCLTKYANHAPNMTDIALYDTRVHDLNATDVPALADNGLHKNLMETARSKVLQSNMDLLQSQMPTYNPFLPVSETNKPTTNIKSAAMDERLNWHTNERPWNYESDRANIAFDLQRSPHIKERNDRQREADDALFNRHHVNRYNEAKMAYMDRSHDPDYNIDEYMKHQSSKDNERHALTPIHTKEAFINSRNGFNETDSNKLVKDVYGTFQPIYARKMNEMYDREILKSRMEQFSPNAIEDYTSIKGLMNNVTSHITETIKSFFGWNDYGSKSSLHREDGRVYIDADGSVMFDESRSCTPLPVEVNTSFDNMTERYHYKPSHMLVVRDGNVPAYYPDENVDYTAVSFMQSDPLNTGIIRTIVMLDGAKFKIIQKRANDGIFTGDNKPYGDDYVIAELPVTMIDEKMRERIRKNNMDSKRDKVLELTYNDFVAFSDYLVKHPEVQQRIKHSDLHQRVRTNKYDSDIITNFEGRKTFMDDKVYAVISNDNVRMKQQKINVGRIDKDQIPISDGYSNQAPVNSALSGNETSETYRKIQHYDTPCSSRRSGGVVMRKFNS